MEFDHFINDEILNIGDKVDLVTQSGELFRTMIEDKLESGLYLAGVPNRKGLYMRVEQDDGLYLIFYRDTGRYIAHMKVVALERNDAVRYMWLEQKTRIQKNQRRGAFRLSVSFDVQIFEYIETTDADSSDTADEAKPTADEAKPTADAAKPTADEAETTTLEVASSRDISLSGIALITKRKFEVNEKCLLGLHFSRTSANIRSRLVSANMTPDLQLAAEVRRCVPWRTGNTYNIGMQFIGMTDSMSDSIARYVVAEQQRQLKKRSMYT